MIALAVLIILSPVYLVVAVLVRVNLGSPVLFTQERPGLHGKIFRMQKFRSMRNAPDYDGSSRSDAARLTPFGKALRATSLDELPEFVSILKGDMSFVGPRPLLTQYLPWYTREEMHRHDVRPGLTGLAQVNGRNNLPWEKRFAYDLQYVRELSFALDVKIVLQTVGKVLKRSDVKSGEEQTLPDFDVYRRAQREKAGTDNKSG